MGPRGQSLSLTSLPPSPAHQVLVGEGGWVAQLQPTASSAATCPRLAAPRLAYATGFAVSTKFTKIITKFNTL